MLTMQDIQNMTPEEVAATNTKLAKLLWKQFALLTLAKWTLIIAVHYFGRKFVSSRKKP